MHLCRDGKTMWTVCIISLALWAHSYFPRLCNTENLYSLQTSDVSSFANEQPHLPPLKYRVRFLPNIAD